MKTFFTKDGLFGLSIILALLIFTLTMIGGDGKFLFWIGDYFNNLAHMNDQSGTGSYIIYKLSDTFNFLGNFMNGVGSSEWSKYFIPIFGENSFTGVEIFSAKNSMKVNALITFVPVFFITLLAIFNLVPALLLNMIKTKKVDTVKEESKKPMKKELSKLKLTVKKKENLITRTIKFMTFSIKSTIGAFKVIGEETGWIKRSRL